MVAVSTHNYRCAKAAKASTLARAACIHVNLPSLTRISLSVRFRMRRDSGTICVLERAWQDKFVETAMLLFVGVTSLGSARLERATVVFRRDRRCTRHDARKWKMT